MAFLSKILFKPNKVLEILSFVSNYYVFKCNEHGRRVRSRVRHVSAVVHCSFQVGAT